MWRPQHINEKIVEQDLQPDIGIQQRNDTAGDQLNRVDGRVPSIRRQILVCRIEGVLTLTRIHEDAEEEIEAVDERLGADQRFPKVHRSQHFAEEFDEDDGAAEAVDGRHDGSDDDGEGEIGEDAGGSGDGSVWQDAEGGVGIPSSGTEDTGVGDYSHYGEDAEGVEPDG